MLSFVALVAGLSTVVQANNVFARQSPATQATPSQCCFLYVRAAGVVRYEGQVRNVTVATVIKEIVIISTASEVLTSTRTRTVYDPTVTDPPPVTLPDATLTGSAIATDLSTIPITAPPSTSTPDSGFGNAPSPMAGASEAFVFTAPQFAGRDGQPSCESSITTLSYTYSAQKTFVQTVTNYGNPLLSATANWFQYNAVVDQGKPIVLPNPVYFPSTTDPTASPTGGQVPLAIPQEFVDYMARVPEVIAQFSDIGKCTAKLALPSGTFVIAPTSSVTTTQTTTIILQALTSSAPYGNTTRTTTAPNVPSGPTWVRPTLTSTIWIGPSNTTLPVFTGAAPSQKLGCLTQLLFVSITCPLLVALAILF